MDCPFVLKNTQNVLCLDMERFFLRDVKNPRLDFLQNCFLSRDGIFSYFVQEKNESEFAQLQYGGKSAALLYAIPSPDILSTKLIEGLCQVTAGYGKFHFLANTPADGAAWKFLKANGFRTISVYNLWQVDPFVSTMPKSPQWFFEKAEEHGDIASFYTRLLSPLEASLQSWDFPDVFHLVLHDTASCIRGVARVRYFANRAVLLPLFDCSADETGQYLAALLNDCSKYFSTLFIRELSNHPFSSGTLGEKAKLCLAESHCMARNLAALNSVKEYQPAELLDEKSIAKPSTPFTRSS